MSPRKLLLLFLSFPIVVGWLLAPAAAGNAVSEADMRERFEAFKVAEKAADNPLPFLLRSAISSNHSSASIRYQLKNVAFATLAERLGDPAQWCEFIPLHLNIKSCTWFEWGDQTYLRFYVGTKGYQTPDNAHLLQLRFDTSRRGAVFRTSLFAADGPLDSSNISFDLRAIPVDLDGQPGVYLEFDLSSVPGLAGSLARVYLATIARGKIGFSVEGETWTGRPKYVGGQRGATERNLVRYLLAIETYFDTLEVADPGERFERRLARWYDGTEGFSEQLHELDREDYFSAKRRERANQIALQQTVGQEDPDIKGSDKRR